MKKLNLLALLLIATTAFFSSCKDDNSDKETFSKLAVEEHKTNIESDGVAFVQTMDDLAKLQSFDVINQFVSLQDNNTPVMTVLNNIKAISKAKTTIDLKSYSVTSEPGSLTDAFNQEAGIFTWNSTTQSWDKTEATDQITYKFQTDDQSLASISLYEFELDTASNQDVEGFTVELPVSIKLKLTLDNTDLITFSLTGEYYADDLPKSLVEEVKIEDFNYMASYSLTNQKSLKTSTKFDRNGTIILASGFELDGNISYDNLMTQAENTDFENNDFPNSQDVIDNANAYFQIGNVKAEGIVDVKNLTEAMTNASEDMTEQDMVDMMNKYLKLYVKYGDSGDIIAKSEFYLNEHTYTYYNGTEYVTETEQNLDMKMVFADGSSMDGDFFDSGFGDMINEMNDFITTLNTNFDLGLDPVE